MCGTYFAWHVATDGAQYVELGVADAIRAQTSETTNTVAAASPSIHQRRLDLMMWRLACSRLNLRRSRSVFMGFTVALIVVTTRSRLGKEIVRSQLAETRGPDNSRTCAENLPPPPLRASNGGGNSTRFASAGSKRATPGWGRTENPLSFVVVQARTPSITRLLELFRTRALQVDRRDEVGDVDFSVVIHQIALSAASRVEHDSSVRRPSIRAA
jgi:hypothetical protein